MKSKSKVRSKAQKERWAKYKCYRQAFVNMGCKPMTPEEIKKSRATRPVELILTRKTARYLHNVLTMSILLPDRNKFVILNKLKRSGIK